MNIMIGSSILAMSHYTAAISGSISFMTWALAGLVFLPTVIGVCQIAQLVNAENGLFSYTEKVFGRFAGYMIGFTTLVGYLFVVTTVISVFREAIMRIFPAFAIASSPFYFSLLFVGIVYLLNILSVKVIAAIQDPLTIFKLSPIILAIVFLPFAYDPSFSFSLAGLPALPSTLSFSLFGFFGFEFATNITRHLQNKNDGSRIMLIAFWLTAALYMLFHFSMFHIMGLENFVNFSAVRYAMFLPLPWPAVKLALASCVEIIAAIAIFSTANGVTFGNTSLMHSMSDAGYLQGKSWFSETNRFGRPWVTVLIYCALVVLFGTFVTEIKTLSGISVSAIFITYLATMISLAVLQHRNGASFGKQAFAVFATITTSVVFAYNFLGVGATLTGCFIAHAPIAVGLLVGYLLYRPEHQF